jgi:16S rRNA (guanine527-N7)-methyltransferase
VEHNEIGEWALLNDTVIDDAKIELLTQYGSLLHEANRKFNLTGLKNEKDIMRELILKSIEPFIHLNVPRGTMFMDVGTGAGIPGIPILLMHPRLGGKLVDSNKKKIAFVADAIRKLRIDNATAEWVRVEEKGRGEWRESVPMVFARAVGNIYYVIEIASSILCAGGLLFVYSNIGPEELPAQITTHADELGLSVAGPEEYLAHGITRHGILFKKTGITAMKYPRSISIINRDIIKYHLR